MKISQESRLLVEEKKPVQIEKIFQSLKLLSLASQILLGLLLIVVGLGIIWSIDKWIPVKAEGAGVILSQKGLIEIMAKLEGRLVRFNVKNGQKIKEGDLLAELYNPELELKLQAAKMKLENLEKEYERLSRQIKIEEKAIKDALKREIQANEFALQQVEQQIKSLNHELNVRRQFHAKGLISYTLVQQTDAALVQQEIEIESVKEKLASLQADLSKGYRTVEVSIKEREIQDKKKEVAILEVQLENGKIYSSYDGTVISLLKDMGQLIKIGEPLLLLELSSSHQEESFLIYGYFAIDKGKDIRPGTPIEIEFSHLRESEYGKMLGIVQHVSEYAVSSERLLNVIYNKQLIDLILGNSTAVLEVTIAPLRNPSDPKEYLWTRGRSPLVPITTGIYCLLYAIVEEKKPLYFILPMENLKRRPIIQVVEPSSNQ